MSMLFRQYKYIASPEKITQFYNKYKVGLIKELALEYTEASIVNKKIIKSYISLWFAHFSVAIFTSILLVFYFFNFFIKNGSIIILYKYIVNFFCL